MIGRLLHRAATPTVTAVTHAHTGPWPLTGDWLEGVPYVDEEQARDLPIVSAALAMMVSLVGQMPLRAMAGREVVDPPPPILRNPAPGANRTLVDFIREYIVDVTLFGNYVAVLGDPDWTGWPATLYPVPWGQWSLDHDGTYVIAGQRYRPEEIFHVCTGCRTGEHVGRGLLQNHRRLLASAVAAETWASRYFDGGAVPPAVLTHPDPELDQTRAELIRDKLRAATRARTAIVVPAGTTITPLSSDADKAQLAETRRWNALQLAQAMGIPPALLGLDSQGLTYRNITDLFSQWVSTAIIGALHPLEEQLTDQCLPRTLTARFGTEAVLRPDLAARVDLAIKGLQGGVFSRTEARALVDLPPDPQGDEGDEETTPQLSLVEEEPGG